ncbi:hypothetical protein [Oceanicoccus sagamiensis]|uniref:YcxB-like protein domain-containing protein n=1 Tax=Oceanicoccus sagamiensis TaxID=716816 RepID=A0A1X9NK41_9GAMM|nr:hypothetical protein [Oceanicoccus sagamiensis]ARN74333.1 hypothetical protein BST96_09475 [Oceanicoccus sagamiensis]
MTIEYFLSIQDKIEINKRCIPRSKGHDILFFVFYFVTLFILFVTYINSDILNIFTLIMMSFISAAIVYMTRKYLFYITHIGADKIYKDSIVTLEIGEIYIECIEEHRHESTGRIGKEVLKRRTNDVQKFFSDKEFLYIVFCFSVIGIPLISLSKENNEHILMLNKVNKC